MPNKRISDLQERELLYSDSSAEPFPHSAHLIPASEKDNKTFFLLARPKVRNETISYANLKSSILDSSMYLTGNQLISGSKIFADPCTFESRISTNEILDNTFTGDISGNIFVGESGLLQNLYVGKNFFERRSDDSQYTFHISGDSCFLGNNFQDGDHLQEGGFLRIGSSTQTGDSFINGDKTITGDFYLGRKLYHLEDEDSHIHFEEDYAKLQAGELTSAELNENINKIS